MRRLLIALAMLAALATTAPSCLSPTLPLPPPDLPDGALLDSTGLWQISGHCTPGALVSVFNTRTGRGVQVEDLADLGIYHVALAGRACDQIRMEEQETDGDVTQPNFFLLQAYINGAPVDPNACP
jgi:hypothetical protein